MKSRPKELVDKIIKKSWETRRSKSEEYYKHRDTGEVIKSLGLACEVYNINYKSEWQRQYRKSKNRVFDRL